MKNKFAVIDLETTGGTPRRDKITEIAIIVYDGDKIIDEFQSLVNPERSIPSNITRITGITNEMVSDAPKFYEIAKQVIEKTEDCIFVAHNVRFDYGFLVEEFKSLGFTFSKKKICTVKLSRSNFPGLRSYSLGNLIKHFNIEVNNRHRAYDDARATTILLDKILRLNEGKGFNEIISESIKLSGLPRSIKPEQVLALPKQCGVYYMLDEDGQIVYIGKSINIQNRIKQHFSKNTRKTDKIFQSVNDIHYEVTGSELISLIKESYEIKKYLPSINKAQKTREYRYALIRSIDKSGYYKFEIKLSKHAKNAIAFYSSKRNAQNHLEHISELYELCNKVNGLDNTRTTCFKYNLNKCRGACIGEELSINYNERFLESIEYLNSVFNRDFIIVEKGRSAEEKAIILIEGGHFRAFGFIDDLLSYNSIENIKDQTKAMPLNPEVDKIIRNYIWNNPELEIHSFDDE